jgi:hypothetical protein
VVSLLPSSIVANGTSTTTATATVTDAHGNGVPGDTVSFSSSHAGNAIGPVTNNHDGTYTATITSSETAQLLTITATDKETGVFGQAGLTQTVGPAAHVSIELSPSSIVANGASTTTATIVVEDSQGRGLAAQTIDISTSDNGVGIGAVAERGGGVYTETLTSSELVHQVTVIATDTSGQSPVTGTATLTQTVGPAANVSVGLSRASIPADGGSTSTATAIVTDEDGNRLPDVALSIHTSDPANGVRAIIDNGNGSYRAQIVSSTTVHVVTVTATVISAMPPVSGSATLTQTLGAPAVVTLSLTPSSVPANGTATATATATVSDAAGHPLAREPLALSSSDPGVRIGPVTDRGDGGYLATMTSSTTAHPVTITATDAGASPSISSSATLTQTASALPPPPATCRLPNLLRKTKAQALQALHKARCSGVVVRFLGAHGVVLSQTIPPATVIRSKTKLSLRLGRMRGATRKASAKAKKTSSVPPRRG